MLRRAILLFESVAEKKEKEKRRRRKGKKGKHVPVAPRGLAEVEMHCSQKRRGEIPREEDTIPPLKKEKKEEKDSGGKTFAVHSPPLEERGGNVGEGKKKEK